jgi:hypothetical protein
MEDNENIKNMAEPVVEAPVEITEPELIPEKELSPPDPLLHSDSAEAPPDKQEGEPAPSSTVDINPAENITEVHTRPTESFGQAPETVTITEVMQPEGTKMPMVPDARSFLKNLLPKLREKLALRTEKRLSKIIELARERGKIESGDIQKLLRVSDTSATTYFHKLIARGNLKTSGNPHRPTYLPN